MSAPLSPEEGRPALVERLRSLLDDMHAAGMLLDVVIGEWTTGALHADDEYGECQCPDPEGGNWSPECKALNDWRPALLLDDAGHGPSLLALLPDPTPESPVEPEEGAADRAEWGGFRAKIQKLRSGGYDVEFYDAANVWRFAAKVGTRLEAEALRDLVAAAQPPAPADPVLRDQLEEAHRWLTQTILHDPDHPEVIGNCWQTCIASLLNLPLDDVPHFAAEHDDWAVAYNATRRWARERGYELMFVGDDQLHDSPVIGLLTGRSPRGVQHVVIGRGDQIVHDPHPSRAGLETIQGAYLFIPLAASVEGAEPE